MSCANGSKFCQIGWRGQRALDTEWSEPDATGIIATTTAAAAIRVESATATARTIASALEHQLQLETTGTDSSSIQLIGARPADFLDESPPSAT